MITIVFATNNRHKLDEVRSILGKTCNIVSLADIGCREDIPETSNTLEGNALLKARYVKQHYGYDCFADDTGLEVKALNNAPGVYSARYAGEKKDSSANRKKLLTELENQNNREARFRTVISLVWKEQEYLFEGEVKGHIIDEERGQGGFGYDPVFIPEGYGQTFAEMDDEIKNTISHRAKAVKQLEKWFDATN